MAKILVVDDNESICQLVVEFFGSVKGHEVYAANEAQKALKIVEENPIEVALLDIMMPEVHGVELLRRIRRIAPDLKAIMITAVDDESIAQEAIKVGAVDYVTKPLDLNYLDTVVTFQLLGLEKTRVLPALLLPIRVIPSERLQVHASSAEY